MKIGMKVRRRNERKANKCRQRKAEKERVKDSRR
jgi:hypothetical protein